MKNTLRFTQNKKMEKEIVKSKTKQKMIALGAYIINIFTGP